jgi:hypothetical protein
MLPAGAATNIWTHKHLKPRVKKYQNSNRFVETFNFMLRFE